MTVRMFVRLSCDIAGCGVVLMTEQQTENDARGWASRHNWDYNGWDFCPDHNTPAKRREADRARVQARVLEEHNVPPTIAAGSMASEDRGDDGDFDDRG